MIRQDNQSWVTGVFWPSALNPLSAADAEV
jgi:hypothetical protein